MTQLQAARSGVVTEAMKIVAADEGVDPEAVRAAVASGEAVNAILFAFRPPVSGGVRFI